MEGPKLITLTNFAEGAAEELWQAAMKDVLQNVDDPNTDAETKRRITLTFVLSPDENRRGADVTVACSTKLAGVRAVQSRARLGRHLGALVAVEEFSQEDLFQQPAGKPAAVPMTAPSSAGAPIA